MDHCWIFEKVLTNGRIRSNEIVSLLMETPMISDILFIVTAVRLGRGDAIIRKFGWLSGSFRHSFEG